MQVLNKYDKEQLVIELHSQGKTIREIASAAHLSFTDIGKIIRKIDGRNNDDVDLKNKTKTTQALHLFKSGKKPIDVAIELD
jgi:lipopolysaccharide biosynthesis protein